MNKKKYSKLIIYTDGGARGNPGPAGIGAVAYNEQGEIVFEISEYIGEATNNQAEYQAAVAAIEKAKEAGAKQLYFYLDSELIVKQLNGEYKIKNKDLQPLFVKIYNKSLDFQKVEWKHVRREKNKEADRLVNSAIDQFVNNN
jgi:ribonuclease HI